MDNKDTEIAVLRDLLEKEQIKVKKEQRKNKRLRKAFNEFVKQVSVIN